MDIHPGDLHHLPCTLRDVALDFTLERFVFCVEAWNVLDFIHKGLILAIDVITHVDACDQSRQAHSIGHHNLWKLLQYLVGLQLELGEWCIQCATFCLWMLQAESRSTVCSRPAFACADGVLVPV